MQATLVENPLNIQLDLEFNWKDDTNADTELWGLSLPFSVNRH